MNDYMKMKNAYSELLNEVKSLPETFRKRQAIISLKAAYEKIESAYDEQHNPPGKVVVRNNEGEVTGLQG